MLRHAKGKIMQMHAQDYSLTYLSTKLSVSYTFKGKPKLKQNYDKACKRQIFSKDYKMQNRAGSKANIFTIIMFDLKGTCSETYL